jgi:hypothetical protein
METRLENLTKMYRKYHDAGLTVQAQRTLDRIREIGGEEAVLYALQREMFDE